MISKEKIFFVSLLIVLIVGLSVVSATDNSTIDIKKVSHKEVVKTSNNMINKKTIEKNKITNNTKNVKTTQKIKNLTKKYNKNDKTSTQTVDTYNQLYDALTSDTDSDLTINLNKQTYKVTQCIELNDAIKNLNINGNGATIDGDNSFQFLNINHKSNIAISDLTITNCYKEGNGIDDVKGGAIYNAHSNLTLNNVNFTKNSVYNYPLIERIEEPRYHYTYFPVNATGGAIYTTNSNLTIINSMFSSNNATIELKNNNFNGYVLGGALYADSTYININDSIFDSNELYYTPENYNSFGEGSSIYTNNSNIKIYKSEFKNHNGFIGGVIHEENSVNWIDYSEFINNTSEYGEAALSLINTNSHIRYSNFSYNFGSSIYTFNSEDYLYNLDSKEHTFENQTVEHCLFLNDTSQDIGAAIYMFNVTLIVTHSNFTNCFCPYIAGGIYNGAGNLTINYTNFDNIGGNHTEVYETWGGFAEIGEVIFHEGDYLLIDNSNFTNNRGIMGVVASWTTGHSTGDNNILVNNCLFKNNTSISDGILVNSNGILLVNNTDFISNSLIPLEEGCGAIYTAYGNTSIFNTNFINNSINFTDKEGYENYVRFGAAIRAEEAIISINTSNFTNNSIYRKNIIQGYGGTANGGAVSAINTNITVSDSTFENNSAKTIESDGRSYESWGGAIYTEESNLKVFNSEFTSNKATRGGAIYCEQNLTINNSKFTANGVLGEIGYGGAIYINGNNFLVNNSFFTYNTASEYGGAIYINAFDSTILNSTFVNNMVYGEELPEGAAIFGYTKLNDSVFIKNDPYNFVIKEDKIYLDYLDEHMPDNAKVTIYLDESNDGTDYSLVVDQETGDIYIQDFKVDENNYLIKMVVTELPNSNLYSEGRYVNNIYYIQLPTTWVISVNASDVYVGEKTRINGSLYYLKKDGSKVYYSNNEIRLYINGTYITNTTTDKNGNYEFYYQANVIGQQEILVNFTGKLYIDSVTNETVFNVFKKDSKIIFDNMKDVKVGEKTIVNGKLVDNLLNPINNSVITLSINNNAVNITTGKDGKFNYEFKTVLAGDNYIFAYFAETNIYKSSFNSTSFEVNKLNTKITITATNTVFNQPSMVKGQLVDEKGNKIINTSIKLFINNDAYNLVTDNNGEFKTQYLSSVPGENYAIVFFEGNNNYIDSLNKTLFDVERISTKITVTATNTTVNKKSLIKGKLIDINGNKISGVNVSISVDGKIIANVVTNKNGIYYYNYIAKNNGTYKVLAVFTGNKYFKSSNTTTKLVVKSLSKIKTKISVKSYTVVDGQKVTLVATVKDYKGKLVNTGKVVFKINMKSVKDSKGKTVYVDVKNGKAKLTFTPEKGLYNKNSDVNAFYNGTDEYQSASSNTGKLLMVKRNATITFTTKSIKAKSYDTITIKVKINDKNGSKIKEGNVTFKLNSKTIGVGTIKNGVAVLKYNINGKTAKTYKITTVYSALMYNRVQKTINLDVVKTPTKISVNPIKTSSKTFTVKAKILDNKGKSIKKTTKVSIKINGKTYVKEVKVSNGKINIKVPTKLSKGTYTLNIIAGTNGYYKESRKNTKLTII